MRANRSHRQGFHAPYFSYTGLQFKARLREMLKRTRKMAEWAQIFDFFSIFSSRKTNKQKIVVFHRYNNERARRGEENFISLITA